MTKVINPDRPLVPRARKRIPVSDFSDLACTGIYLLLQGDTVVYVGQAKVIRHRVAAHISEGFKKFDSVMFVRCDLGSLDRLEREYIQKLLPKYNQCSLSKQLRKLHTLGCQDITTHGELKTKQIRKRYPRSSRSRTVMVLA